MNAFLSWLWQATLAGSTAAVLTVLLGPLMRRWLGAQAAFLAWAFALALFVSPWFVRSPVSVIPPASELPPVFVRIVIPQQPAIPPTDQISLRHTNFPWIFTLWAAGAAAVSLLSLARLLYTVRIVRDSKNRTAGFQTTMSAIGGLPPRTEIRESTAISSPAVCGILRPVILLPTDWTNHKDDLHWVLLHEIGHIRRGDLLWRWAFQFVCTLHWFNPLVWIADRAASMDQEMACDEWVLGSKEATDGMEYGEAILRAASQPRSKWFIRAGMAESKSGLARRIRHLTKVHPRGMGALAITLVIGTAAILLLSPGWAEENPPKPQVKSPAGNFTFIEIESKFVETSMTPEAARAFFQAKQIDAQTILSEDEALDLLKRLDRQKGVDIVSAPRVTTRSGQRATIQIVREFSYPTEFDPPKMSPEGLQIPAWPSQFVVEPVGITLDVEPSVTSDNRIICEVNPRLVEFLGFMSYDPPIPVPSQKHPFGTALKSDAMEKPKTGIMERMNASVRGAMDSLSRGGSPVPYQQPIFRRREVDTTVILRSGQTVLLGGLSRKAEEENETLERILYVFITARLTNAQGKPASPSREDSSTQTPLPATSPRSPTDLPPSSTPHPNPLPPSTGGPKNFPYGTPVPNKPGFVTSPHAPDKGWVDLRGFPPGTEVKCPYTGEIFLVP